MAYAAAAQVIPRMAGLLAKLKGAAQGVKGVAQGVGAVGKGGALSTMMQPAYLPLGTTFTPNALGKAAMVGVAAAPGVLGYTHGRDTGYHDPNRSGIGGTLGYSLLHPLAGLGYAVGHSQGHDSRQSANDKEINAQVEKILRQREAQKRLQDNLTSILIPTTTGFNPSPGNI